MWTEINERNSNPCQNSSICEDHICQQLCTWLDWHYWWRDHNDCASYPCALWATRLGEVKNFTSPLVCAPGCMGNRCQIECTTNSCFIGLRRYLSRLCEWVWLPLQAWFYWSKLAGDVTECTILMSYFIEGMCQERFWMFQVDWIDWHKLCEWMC